MVHGPHSVTTQGLSRGWGSRLLHMTRDLQAPARRPSAFPCGSIFLGFLEKGIAVGTWATYKTTVAPFSLQLWPLPGTQVGKRKIMQRTLNLG